VRAICIGHVEIREQEGIGRRGRVRRRICNPGPIIRECRLTLQGRAGGQWPDVRSVRAGRVELATGDERDPAVRRRTEDWRQLVCARDQEERGREGHDEQGEDDQDVGSARRGRPADCERCQGEPPFEQPPGGKRTRSGGPLERRCEQLLRRSNLRVPVKPVGHEGVEFVGAGVVRHETRPPATAWARASASSVARIARVARWSRERTVPGGRPRTTAASSRPSPR
jgi:hypothetical protein